jgi:hypothetical protein
MIPTSIATSPTWGEFPLELIEIRGRNHLGRSDAALKKVDRAQAMAYRIRAELERLLPHRPGYWRHPMRCANRAETRHPAEATH